MTEHVQHLLAATDAEGLIDQILCARRLRTAAFGPGLFSDPAWDIVLTLYRGQLRGETVFTAQLADSASVAPGTIARWVDVLARQGLVEVQPAVSEVEDPVVALSALGSSAMRRWLAQWLNCQCIPESDTRVTTLLQRLLNDTAE
jgi:hypothetical protein